MRILPIINQKLHSPYSSAVLSARLAEITDRSGENVFVGTVRAKSFSVYKKPSNFVRNSFLPIASGKLQDTEDGCTVDIKVRMHPIAEVFLLIWSLGVLAGLFASIIMVFTTGFSETILYLLFPLLMLAFEFILLFVGFHLPSKTLIDILVRTFS